MKKLLMIVFVLGVSFNVNAAFDNSEAEIKLGQQKFTDCAATLCLEDRTEEIKMKSNKRSKKSRGRGVMAK